MMKTMTTALAVVLTALTTTTNAFLVPSRSTGTSDSSTRIGGVPPDQFGEWMLPDHTDYDVHTGPNRRMRPLRVNSRQELTQQQGPSNMNAASKASAGNYLSQLQQQQQQPPMPAQAQNYNNNYNYNNNNPPKVYHYSAQSYRQQDEFINKAQGTNTMEYQLEHGVPHQMRITQGDNYPVPPARTELQRYYSREYQQQEEFINKAQGTNRMDAKRPLGGMSHQDEWCR